VSDAVWDDTFLEGLRSVGDPEADGVISGLFAGTADAPSAFRSLVVEQNEQVDPNTGGIPE
jgi:hypothetical protein